MLGDKIGILNLHLLFVFVTINARPWHYLQIWDFISIIYWFIILLRRIVRYHIFLSRSYHRSLIFLTPMILILETLHVLRFTIVDFNLQELCLQWLWLSFIHWFLDILGSCGVIHWHLFFSFGTREDTWRVILQGVNWALPFILICLMFWFHVIHISHEGEWILLRIWI